MRVAIVAGAFHRADPGFYGSESQAGVLAKGFLKAGHDVTFLAAAGSEPVGKFRTVPCMYGTIFPNEEQNYYEWYRTELLQQDLIIDWSGTHRVTESIYFWERAKFTGVLIWSHQGNVLTSPRPPAIYNFHGTVVSKAQYDHAMSYWAYRAAPIARERLHVIPYGIDTERYHVPTQKPSRDYFLYLSRPHPHKGILEFLELAKLRPQYNFVMAFDMAAPDHKVFGEQAIAAAKELPNVTYVPLRGSLATKVGLYQNALALVTPLQKEYVEGFGLVFAEAMACGTPCITATHGGQVEVVGKGADCLGWLCETRDEYLVALDQAVKGAPYEECRRRIVRKFGIERWVKAYMKLYTKVRRAQDTPPWQPLPEWMYQ
jgi:glycosyltransferase involved in cell wall biosynthesis